MKIEDSRTNKTATFKDLSFGDCFIYDGQYYIKIDGVNAFKLECNSISAFLDGNKIVAPVNAKVVIE